MGGKMPEVEVQSDHLIADIVACRIHLVQLRSPLLINANDYGHHSQWSHVRMLHGCTVQVSALAADAYMCDVCQQIHKSP